MLKYLITFFIFIFSIHFLSSQSSLCNDYLDSTKCFLELHFVKSKIIIEKKWESEDLISTNQAPMIADMDGDCIPEFVVISETLDSIIIIDSKSGKTKSKFSTLVIQDPNTNLLIADINNDGNKEIIFTTPYLNKIPFDYRIVCYSLTGNLIWVSNQFYFGTNNNKNFPSLGIADFNQDGIPEIYCFNRIFNARTGVFLAAGKDNDGTGNNLVSQQVGYHVSVAAQLDQDINDLELAAGFSVYKVRIINPNGLIGNSLTPYNISINNNSFDGRTSVADINHDDQLDIIVSHNGDLNTSVIYVYSILNNIPVLLAKTLSSSIISYISCTTISDINGDGLEDILITRDNAIDCYKYDGSDTLKLFWSYQINDPNAFSSISTFDFDQDGKNEILHRGIEFIYIIDGSNNPPVLISSSKCLSYTLNENCVIADIDNSGTSKICIPCATEETLFNFSGYLTIFGPPDSLPGWAPARKVWNQYAYNPLYINDDLTVPQYQKNQATYKSGKYNNFMQQESLLDSNGYYKKPAASLRGAINCINYDPQTMEYIIIFDLYNRKDASNSADSGLAVSFYNGDPTNGGTLIGIYYTLNSINSGDSLLNLQLRISASNLTDLFMVVNTIRKGSGVFDDNDFTQIECDYTDNISRSIDLPRIDSLAIMICKGSSYQFIDTIIQDAGRYYGKLSRSNGCDSVIRFLDLTTVDTIFIKQSAQACDTYLWNGKILTQSGTFVFDTLNQYGCDSIVSLDLKINKSSSSIIRQSSCNYYNWNGLTYDQSGRYQYQTINQQGCDSLAKLELVIHKSDSTKLDVTTCNSYSWNGRNYLQSGIYILDTINQFGCDSTVHLKLKINSEILNALTQTSCDSYNWNGKILNQSGIYIDTTQSSKGCDSITTLQLTINKSVASNTIQTSCDSYNWNGNNYTQSGNYSFATKSSNGCDSIANLQLTITKSSNSITTISNCNNYTWNNINYTQSGSFDYKTLNAFGCDSIATLNLTINKADSILMKQTACNDFIWNTKNYTQSGKYLFQTTNVKGCDSIVTLDLTINSNTIKDTSRTICDSLNFLGKTLKTSGNYSFTIPNTQGCDSIISLSLKISSQEYKDSISRCGTYIWPINGRMYDSSGVYVEKYSNISGCDSIFLLNLIINKNYEIKENAEACKEFLWQVNKQLYTESGAYSYPLKTSVGCDSILQLNLSISPEYKQIDTIISNSDYLWPVNKQIYPSSGTYEEDYTSSYGCDSIHLLLLTINKEVSIYYPNVIHPGGLNEWFTIFVYGNSAIIKVLSIYDRWGELIWQKLSFPPNELQKGWNGQFKGQNVLPGVYVWHAEIELPDGRVVVEKGDVTILR